MNDLPLQAIPLEGPGDVVAAIPYLLGFHPTDSVVVIALAGELGDIVDGAIRADIPPAAEYNAFAHHLALDLLRQRASAVVVAIVGHGEADLLMPLPHQGLAKALDHEMRAHGVELVHTVWAAATTEASGWHCYDDAEHCNGQVPSPDGSALAAMTVAAGRVTFANRAEFEDTLGPDNHVALARRSRRIAELRQAADRDGALTGPQAVRAAVGYVRHVLQAASLPAQLDDEHLGRLAIALSLVDVRVICLGEALGERASAAEALWYTLTRAIPAPYRAHPAALLAVSAYLRGEYPLANLALRKAEAADPGHTIAGTLRLAMQHGLSPLGVAAAVTQVVAMAEAALGIDQSSE